MWERYLLDGQSRRKVETSECKSKNVVVKEQSKKCVCVLGESQPANDSGCRSSKSSSKQQHRNESVLKRQSSAAAFFS